MSEVSKNELKYDNSVSFPNNNNGAITPADLRNFNVDLIDSTVNQTLYTADSASFTSRISDTDVIVDTLISTASVLGDTLTFTKQNGSTFNLVVTASVVTIPWNDVSDKPSGLVSGSSQVVSILGPLNAYTASNNTKWSNIGSQSGSWVTESETGSFARTNITNNFTATQNITGDLNITGTLTATEIHTIIESSSVIFSSGSNILGDNPTGDTQTLNGVTTINGNTTITGSISQAGGTNTINGATTINNNTIIGNGGTLNVGGVVLAQSGIYSLSGNAITIAQNTLGSGSQYPGFNAVVSTAETPTDVYGGFSVNNSAGQTLTSLVVNSYAPQYFGTPTPVIIAAGNNPDGSDTAIGFPSDGTMDVWKKSNFKYGIEATGSVKLTPASVSTNAQYVIPFISGSTISKDSVDTLFYNPSSNALQVSASAVGLSSLNTSGYNYSSGSSSGQHSTAVTKNGFTNVSTPGYYIQMSGNPSLTGAPSLTTSTKPGILALSSSAQPYVAIELQASQSFTDGRVTIKRPLIAEQGSEITGSLNQSGSTNTFNGQTTINANTIVGNGGTLNVGGQITGNNSLLLQSDGANINIQKNSAGSGSAYSSVNIKVDNTTDPTNVYSSLQIVDDATFNTLGLAWNSYSPYYTNSTPMIVANGFYTNSGYSASDVAIAFPTNTIDIWKPTTFKTQTIVSGSVRGNVNGITLSTATASLDFSTSNFFTLVLPGGDTRIEAVNVKPGQTISLKVSQDALGAGTVTMAPQFKFPEFSSYTASLASNAVDLLTFVTFDDTSSIYSAAVKNLI